MFYESEINQEKNVLRDACAANFWNMPIRGTCLSLDDFDDYYEIKFEKEPENFDLNYLLNFCEYTYNLVMYTTFSTWGYGFQTPRDAFMIQLNRVADLIGYMFSASENGVSILVPNNHNSMKGNLDKKRNILIVLADKLEANRKKLKQINSKMEDHLYFLLNNLNIRHNNTEQGSKEYRKYVADMDKETLEKWYDETYQMCLLAFLELDNLERKEKVEQLKQALS